MVTITNITYPKQIHTLQAPTTGDIWAVSVIRRRELFKAVEQMVIFAEMFPIGIAWNSASQMDSSLQVRKTVKSAGVDTQWQKMFSFYQRQLVRQHATVTIQTIAAAHGQYQFTAEKIDIEQSQSTELCLSCWRCISITRMITVAQLHLPVTSKGVASRLCWQYWQRVYTPQMQSYHLEAYYGEIMIRREEWQDLIKACSVVFSCLNRPIARPRPTYN